MVLASLGYRSAIWITGFTLHAGSIRTVEIERSIRLRGARLSYVKARSMATSPKICVFGTGAIGATYTWVLSRAISPSNLVCICRSNYDAASKNGFTINSNIWGDNVNVKPVVTKSIASAAEHGPFDYVLVTSKDVPTTPAVPEMLKPIIAPETAIVLIQNGIGIEKPWKKVYPSNPLMSCVVYLPVTSTAPAVIAHREVENLQIGTYPSDAPSKHHETAREFTELVKEAGATASYHEDVQSQRWSKLVVNASWNPICAISRSRDAAFMKASPNAAGYIRDIMLEIAAVAQAAGYPEIDEKLVDYQLGRAKVRPLPGVEPSMLADALAGRPMEVDAIVGNLLVVAEENGVKTPLLNGVYATAKALDESLRAQRA
jgi:2-dehydropantoate 2-reductase